MGVLSDDEIKKAMPFCVNACNKLSSYLKDISFEDRLEVIIACAGLALYNYTLLCSTGNDFSSFKAGDVTISRSSASAIESAIKLRDESIVNASPFLKDINFMFEAVDV
jgi:hypothetical protein